MCISHRRFSHSLSLNNNKKISELFNPSINRQTEIGAFSFGPQGHLSYPLKFAGPAWSPLLFHPLWWAFLATWEQSLGSWGGGGEGFGGGGSGKGGFGHALPLMGPALTVCVLSPGHYCVGRFSSRTGCGLLSLRFHFGAGRGG